MSYVCCMRQTRGIGYKLNTRHCVASLLKLSLVPRPCVGGKSSLVSTVCTCANDSGNFPRMSPVTDKLHMVVLRRNNQARYVYGLQRGSCVYVAMAPLSVVSVLLRRNQSTCSEFLLTKERSRAKIGTQAYCWKYWCLQTMPWLPNFFLPWLQK